MREIIHLNDSWHYYEHVNENDINSLKENNSVLVDIPHTNKVTEYNCFDEKKLEFISCYKKSILIHEGFKDKTILLCFEGVMAYAKVYVGGRFVGEHKGGYTPFKFEITEYINFGKETQITVVVDSTQRDDIPPFGNVVDYLTYGGIYREVFIEVAEKMYIEEVLVSTENVLSEQKKVLVKATINYKDMPVKDYYLILMVLKEGLILKNTRKKFNVTGTGRNSILAELEVSNVDHWDIDNPTLYDVAVIVGCRKTLFDERDYKIGFREANFTPEGFFLNGKRVKLVGLNRHQSYPYVGYAMPKRVQEKDADILKNVAGVNIVRTSHYPQSRHFLNKCDEIGLLVLEEIPGWQHIGGSDWKEVSYNDVRDMITRDYNHPSIVLWGVRINESGDDDAFYKVTNEIAKSIDGYRQTGGIRAIEGSNLIEDVYTFNDFIFGGGEKILRNQKEVTGKEELVPYMVTEYNGHMFPTKSFDHENRRVEHSLRHLKVINKGMGDDTICGTIGWCAFDYNTHFEFGSGDKICHHGVMDMFRNEKVAIGAYKSATENGLDTFMDITSLVSRGEQNEGFDGEVVIYTNCDYIEVDFDGERLGRFYPDKDNYENVKHAPVFVRVATVKKLEGKALMDYLYSKKCVMIFDGYKDGKKVLSKTVGGNVYASELVVEADDDTLKSTLPTYDATRVRVKALDNRGNPLPYIIENLDVEVHGVGELIGPSRISLIGGQIAFWVKTIRKSGDITVHVNSVRFGEKKITITVD